MDYFEVFFRYQKRESTFIMYEIHAFRRKGDSLQGGGSTDKDYCSGLGERLWKNR